MPWSPAPRAGEVAVFTVDDRREVRRLRTGAGPIGVVEPSGGRAFVANTEDGRIAIIDLARMEVVGSVAVGKEPDGMALAAPK